MGVPRNLIHMRALLLVRVAKYTTTSTTLRSSSLKAPVPQRQSPCVSVHPLSNIHFTTSEKATRSSSKVQIHRKKTRPETTPLGPLKLVSQTLAQKIVRFQAKLLKIQRNINKQIPNIDILARTLGVEEDRLYPLVHCKHVLQLDTTNDLQELLKAIGGKPSEQQALTTQEDSTAIWLESRILAVQLWIVKRLLLRIEIEAGDKALDAQARFQSIEAQIAEMSLLVAASRNTFRVRPERVEQSTSEGWVMKLFVNDDVEDDRNGLDSSAIVLPQLSLSQRNHAGVPVSQSVLLENLAIVAAYSQQESVIWKIERFLSRIEEVYHRVSRVIGYLDQLAQDLQVTEDRAHPVVSCKRILQLDSFSSLDIVLRILRKRTPKSRLELDQGMGEALWLDSRLPEVQLEVVKMRLWAFHLTTKDQGLPRRQKNLIRSIRGRIKVAHSLLRNSREEFGSYGPQGKFEVNEGVPNEGKIEDSQLLEKRTQIER